MTVAMAFDYFRKEQVEVAVIETGMGGRLDSTNIIAPLVSAVTNIGLDHTQFLGDTLEKVAGEKAGIFKSGIPAVIGEYTKETLPVFESKAKEMGASLLLAQDAYSVSFVSEGIYAVNKGNELMFPSLSLDLKGSYQQKNIKTALAIIVKVSKEFSIQKENIVAGLGRVVQNTGLKGRWQVLKRSPMVICDTGHNVEGVRYLIEQLKGLKAKQYHFVLGMVNDKAIDKVLQLFPQNASYYFTQANIPRALPVNELVARANELGYTGLSFPSVEEAYYAAVKSAGEDEVVFVGGSTFVVAEVPNL
jgi:dihydrofolate synthase/folylpolyglutamate synthase